MMLHAEGTLAKVTFPKDRIFSFSHRTIWWGQTTALTEQCVDIQKLPGVRLTVVTGDKEMEPGLRDKLLEAKCDVHVLPELDAHSSARAKAIWTCSWICEADGFASE